jgi:NTE family protein
MITELCISGGAQRGIAFLGSMKFFEDKGLLSRKEIKKIVGVSIGALICISYIIGYDIAEFMEFVLRSDFLAFQDFSLTDNSVAILKGSMFRKWVRDILKDKIDPDITMSNLYKLTNIHFTVSTTCLEDGIVYISHETHPNFKLYDALICSMNFPFAFPPYEVDNKSYIDGGLIDNFPLHLLGSRALGINSYRKMHNKKEFTPYTYMSTLLQLMTNHIKHSFVYKSDLVIDVDVSDLRVISFDVSIDDKITLYREGYDCAKNNKYVLEKLYLFDHQDRLKIVLEELKDLKTDK